MTNKKEKPQISDENKTTRKFKRIIPTRAAGEQAINKAFENPADDLFARGFAGRNENSTSSEIKGETTIPKNFGIPNEFEIPNQDGLPDEIGIPTKTGNPKNSGVPNKKGTPKKKGVPKISGQTKIEKHPVSPVKNFTKTPNSINKIILANGLFKGQSKKIYDYLWSISRGAVNPARNVQQTNEQIRKGAGIGSKNTVADGIKWLESILLIEKNVTKGSAAGNEFEIFTPEERGYTSFIGLPSQTGHPDAEGNPSDRESQKLGILGIPEIGVPSTSQTSDNSASYAERKTFLNTLSFTIDDDAPVFEYLEILNSAARKTTGRDLTKKDFERLKETFELLINETAIAAARTGLVSAFVAFMNENLRRRLYPKQGSASKKGSDAAGARPAHLDVGKSHENETNWQQPSPMSEEQRRKTLEALREAQSSNKYFLGDFKISGEFDYTPEDFEWLLENLEEGS